jgi:hypothetical protein
MSNQLTLSQIALLSLYAVAMAAGQVLFKLAANKTPVAGALTERTTALLQNSIFGAALLLCEALAIVWVRILSFKVVTRLCVRRTGFCDHAHCKRDAVRGTNFSASRYWYRIDWRRAYMRCRVSSCRRELQSGL